MITFGTAPATGHPTWQLKQRHEKPSVRGRRFMTSAVDAHILLTLADSAVALATSDVASAVASAVEQGATITLTPPVSITHAIDAPHGPHAPQTAAHHFEISYNFNEWIR